MIIEHSNKIPQIHTSAFIAPNAVICGDVTVGENTRIMFGAQIIAESNPVHIGDNCVILENAVIRGTNNSTMHIGNHCLVGPQAHLAGCTIKENVFIATGASIFHGAVIHKNSEVRINAVVHLRTVLKENTVVPINWIAVGNPARLFPPDQHDALWHEQQKLQFNKYVYGVAEEETALPVKSLCNIMSERLKTHSKDRIVEKIT